MTAETLGDVFIVDDNPNNLNLLASILRGGGYRVRMSNSGRRGLGMVEAHPPDLVMLDITMPELDGYQVCAELRAREATRHIPVIFISALDDPVAKLRAFQDGGADYVTKPFQSEEVLARVENQLRTVRLRRQLERREAELAAAYETVRRSEEELRRAREEIARLLAGLGSSTDS